MTTFTSSRTTTVRAASEKVRSVIGVNRKTIRRRLDTLERAETDKAERLAEKRLRRQVTREKRKLYERERGTVVGPPIDPGATRSSISEHRTPAPRPKRAPNAYHEWLDRRK